MNHKRPINLDLGTLKFPTMAIASILHRISGLLIFILLPFIMYFLSLSLKSSESFDHLKELLMNPYYKFILWAFSAAFVYHVIAGIRHILLDLGIGEHLAAAQRSAVAVIILATISTIFLGVWIW